MARYKIRAYVHGAPIDTYKACPYCDSPDLTWPVYPNHLNPSGLSQPMGPLGDNGQVIATGIIRPEYDEATAEPSGYWRPAPLGLSRTYNYPWANDGYFGIDRVTYYSETNLYQNYWGCNNCNKLFLYPELMSSGLPIAINHGNVLGVHDIPNSSQFD